MKKAEDDKHAKEEADKKHHEEEVERLRKEQHDKEEADKKKVENEAKRSKEDEEERKRKAEEAAEKAKHREEEAKSAPLSAGPASFGRRAGKKLMENDRVGIPKVVWEQTSNAIHGTWTLLKLEKGALILKGTGTTFDSLKDAFADNEINFALLTLRVTLAGIADQPRFVFLQWKGPNTSGMARVQGNQKIQEAFALLTPQHGHIEVHGKTNFNEAEIIEKWTPGSGSHVID